MRKRYHEETWGKKNFVRLSEQTGTGGTLNEDIKIHGSVSSLLRSLFFHRYLFSMFFFCGDRENNRQQPVARARTIVFKEFFVVLIYVV